MYTQISKLCKISELPNRAYIFEFECYIWASVRYLQKFQNNCKRRAAIVESEHYNDLKTVETSTVAVTLVIATTLEYPNNMLVLYTTITHLGSTSV